MVCGKGGSVRGVKPESPWAAHVLTPVDEEGAGLRLSFRPGRPVGALSSRRARIGWRQHLPFVMGSVSGEGRALASPMSLKQLLLFSQGLGGTDSGRHGRRSGQTQPHSLQPHER